MADNREQVFIQKIVLVLEEKMKSGGILKALKSTESASSKATSSLTKSGNAFKGLSRMALVAGKAMNAFGIAIKAIAVALGAMKLISSVGKKFILFAAQTGKGNEAINQLRLSYKALISDNNKVVVSLREVTETLSDFANQNFTQLTMATQSVTQSFLSGLQNQLTQKVGSEQAKSLMQELNKEMAKSPIQAQMVMQMAGQGDLNLDKFKQISEVLRVDTGINAFQKVGNVLNSTAENAFLSWSNASNQLRTIFEQLGEIALQVFGSDIQSVLDWISQGFKSILEGANNAIPVLAGIWGSVKSVLSAFSVLALGIAGGMTKLYTTVSGAVLKATAHIVKWVTFGYVDMTEAAKGYIDTVDKMGDWSLDTAKDIAVNMKNPVDAYRSASDAAKKGLDDMNKGINKGAEGEKDLRSELTKILDAQSTLNERIKDFNNGFQGSVNLAKELAENIKLIGNDSIINNISAMSMLDNIMSNIEENARLAIEFNKEGLKLVEKEIAEKQRLLKNNVDDFYLLNEMNKLRAKQATYIGEINKAQKEINNLIELGTVQFQNQLELVERRKNITQTIMGMSKALYGTAALAVDAQMKVIGFLKQEESLIQKELDVVNKRISQEGETQYLLKRRLELENDVLNKQKEQLEIASDLKDGYLDAIEASAFGAGKFEKILITQEKNLGKALDQNLVKKSILIGQSGTAASAGSVIPFGFGTGGMGSLIDSTGAAVNAAARNQQFVNNIADPQARAIAQANHNMVQSNAENIAATNANTEAIMQNNRSMLMAAGAGTLKGTNAGSVATGEAMRTGKNPISSLSGGAAQSKVNRAVRAITNDLIPALQDLARMLDDKIAADENVATDRRGSSGSPTFGA